MKSETFCCRELLTLSTVIDNRNLLKDNDCEKNVTFRGHEHELRGIFPAESLWEVTKVPEEQRYIMLAIVEYETNSNIRGKYCYKRAVRDTCENVIPDQCNAFKKEMVSPLNLEGQYSSLGEISSSSVKLTKIPVKKRFVKLKKTNLG